MKNIKLSSKLNQSNLDNDSGVGLSAKEKLKELGQTLKNNISSASPLDIKVANSKTEEKQNTINQKQNTDTDKNVTEPEEIKPKTAINMLDSKLENTYTQKVSDNLTDPTTDTTNTTSTDTASQESEVYKTALDYTNNLLEQLQSGRTSYTDELNSLIDGFKNRAEFSYTPQTDELYQTYLAAMQNAGQNAMKDTLGQASALTGGYGSTYATQAANSAYNNYIQTANDNMTDFYDVALDNYNRETNDALEKINLVKEQDEDEWNKIYNAYTAAVESQNTEDDTTDNMTAAQTNSLYQKALEAYRSGNKTGLYSYIDSLAGYNLSEDTIQKVMDYVENYANSTYTKTTDKIFNGNDVFTDSNGQAYSYDTLKEMYNNGYISDTDWKAIKKLKEGESYRTTN